MRDDPTVAKTISAIKQANREAKAQEKQARQQAKQTIKQIKTQAQQDKRAKPRREKKQIDENKRAEIRQAKEQANTSIYVSNPLFRAAEFVTANPSIFSDKYDSVAERIINCYKKSRSESNRRQRRKAYKLLLFAAA